jgi:hypothetical protein
MTPGDRVAQLYPQALGTHFSRLYGMRGLQWDYSLIPATTRDGLFIMDYEIVYKHFFKTA